MFTNLELLKNISYYMRLFFLLGKLDKWEWDSGARDMSPVHKSRLRNIEIMENELVKVSSIYIFLLIINIIIKHLS